MYQRQNFDGKYVLHQMMQFGVSTNGFNSFLREILVDFER